MIHFENDYSTGAALEILDALTGTNLEGNTGYGLDCHTARAAELILRECGIGNGSVFFLVGGTQTNSVALDWLCRPGEGVICTPEAHINVHESGAIESNGIKVITIQSTNGKLRADDIDHYMTEFYADPTWPHMVRPATVYVSQTTEVGTLYSKEELKRIREVCDKHHLALYLDGARLTYSLASPENDLTLRDIASLTDMFYFGGTKAGALFGEALIIPGSTDKNRFFSHVKRHGALLAKGWLTGVQFERMFTDSLYQKIGSRAIGIARLLRNKLLTMGYKEIYPSPTNQLFFEIDDAGIERLGEKVVVDVQHRLSENSHLVRFVADWSNSEEDVETLAKCLSASVEK